MPGKLTADQRRSVEETFRRLTIDQKIGQLVCERDRAILQQGDVADWLKRHPVGSVFVGAEIIEPDEDHTDAVRENVRRLQTAAEIPLLFCSDFEHGVGSEVSGLTRLPDPMAMGATFDEDLAYEYGKVIAREAVSVGVRWAFAPVADLNVNPNNPVTNQRSIGDHPDPALRMLKTLVRGMQENGLAATAKHFPGDGVDDRNQHYVTSLNTLGEKRWKRLHGRIFEELARSGVSSMMIGHIGLPAYEKADRATGRFRPATASRRLLTDLLRKEMDFDGILVTDALVMAGFCSWAPYEKRMLDCFESGADVFLWPDTPRFFDLIRKGLRDGSISGKDLDRMVLRVLSFKARMRVASREIPRKLTPEEMAAHREVARKVAERSVTLLRNRAGILPLGQGTGSELLILKAENIPSSREPFTTLAAEFSRRGYRVTLDDFSLFPKYAGGLERFALVVLAANIGTLNNGGSTTRMTGDSARQIWPFVAHPYSRKAFISFGNPYVLHEVASAETYVNAYSNCEATRRAVVKALFGEIPFQGKSPVACGLTFRYRQGTTLE